MRVTTLCVALLCVTSLAGLCEGAAPSQASALLSENPYERSVAFDRIVSERETLIRDLISVVTRGDADKSYNGPLHTAIRLLGKLRATAAVPALSGRLMYLPEYPFGIVWQDEMLPTECYYPCALALRDIGEPSSVRAMVGTIGRASTGEEERDLAAWVIMEIEGKDQTAHRFDDLIKQGGPHKEKYEAAKQFILNYKPVFEPPAALTAAKKQPAGADK
jgi:hypothetical protein